MDASLLYESTCFLGESPMWHDERKSCFWVDIENRRLFEYKWNEKTTRTWQFEQRVSLALPTTKADELLLAFQHGIARFKPDSGAVEWIADVDKRIDIRCNDGACDNKGRLWVGTLHTDFKQAAGALYLIDKDLALQQKVKALTISNGITWSLDNRTLYFIDTPTQKIDAYDYSDSTGQISFKRTVINIPASMGCPDGMTIDEEGMLWIAHYGGSGVYRWNPSSGELIDKIAVPVPHVTSCAFAGESLDHLIITTARENLDAEALEKYPASGHLFYVKMKVKGLPSNKCVL